VPSYLSSPQWFPTIFTLDALPGTTLPIYPSLRQAPNMLACISSGLVTINNKCQLSEMAFSQILAKLAKKIFAGQKLAEKNVVS